MKQKKKKKNYSNVNEYMVWISVTAVDNTTFPVAITTAFYM